MRRLLHEGVRLVREGICGELQPARAQVVPEGNGLRGGLLRGGQAARADHQLDPPQDVRRNDGIRIRGLPGGGRIGREFIDEGVQHAHKGDEEVLLLNGSFGLQFAGGLADSADSGKC